MTINIEKKHLVIGVIVLGVIILGIVGGGIIKNATYMKRAKHCQEDVHVLYKTSALLAAQLHDVWSDYIREDKKYIDRSTGKFYKWRYDSRLDLYYCSSFSEAISEEQEYYENKGVNDVLDSLYASAKKTITKMTPAPKKYSTIHSSIVDLFHTAEAMYNCASSPEGSLVSYTDMINTLSADFKKQSSQVDIEIGESDKHVIAEQEYAILKKFL